MSTQTAGSRPARTRRPGWPVPTGLIALSLIPLTAGTLRLVERFRRRHLVWHRRTGRVTGQVQGDLAKLAGWIINLAVAEWVIRRPARTTSRPRPPQLAGAPS